MGRYFLLFFLLSSLGSLSSTGQADSLTQRFEERGILAASNFATTDMARLYWNGGTRVELPKDGGSLQLQGFTQSRYTFSDNSSKDNTSSFEVSKARLILSGSTPQKRADYFLQTDFLGTSRKEGGQTAQLKDAYVTFRPTTSWGVKIGQFKTLLSRQYVNSDYATQFADRSLASDYFSNGREEGVRIGWGSKDGYTAGVSIFNGLSDHEGANSGGLDTRHTVYADGRIPVFGKLNSFEEGDVDWSEDWALTVGGGYSYSDAAQTFDSERRLTQIHSGSLDANLKGEGWGIHAEMFARGSDVEAPTSTFDASPYGGYLQVGYFVVPRRVEIVGRYSAIDCADGRSSGICDGNNSLVQGSLGVSYLPFRHHLKFQCNYEFLEADPVDESKSETTNKVIIQLSTYF